jgi:Spy/CpxP family protein refolding chaperone
MTKSLKALAAAAVLSLLALPLAAQSAAYDFDGQRPDARAAYNILTHPRALARFLHLSDSQASQLQTLWTTLQNTTTTLRQARGPLCTQLRTDLAATPQNASAVGTDAIGLFNNKTQIHAAFTTFDHAFSAILTPEQLAQYNTLKQIAHLDDDGADGYSPIGACPPPAH